MCKEMEPLAEALNKVIREYEKNCDGKPGTQKTADEADCAYTTIRNIKNGTLTSLSLRKALEISKRLNGPETLGDLMKKIEEDVPEDEGVKEYARKYSHLMDYRLAGQDNFNYFAGHEKYAPIIWAAYSAGNIEKEEVVRKFGSEALEVLLKNGIVMEEDGMVKGRARSVVCDDMMVIHSQIGIMHRKITFPLEKGNWLSSQVASVTAEFKEEFVERLRDLFNEFKEKAAKAENRGTEYVFLGMMFDDFLKITSSGKDDDNKQEVLQ